MEGSLFESSRGRLMHRSVCGKFISINEFGWMDGRSQHASLLYLVES